MIALDSPILIFGAGSIGERHLGILVKLGYRNLWVYRQRNLPLRTLDADDFRIVTNLADLDEVPFVAAIICTPTVQHLEQTRWCVARGIPVLVEKPLSHDLSEVLAFKKELLQNPDYAQKAHVRVAYMLRYHPFFQKIKKQIEEGTLGRLLTMQTYWGEYLPDWHPWEDYRESYAARRELGGGVALTLSHDLDLVNWLSGSTVVDSHTINNYRSSLEIDVESGADVTLRYQNGVTAHCHLNFHERAPRRWYRFAFEEGSVEVDYVKARYTLLLPGQEPEVTVLEDFDRNQLFTDQTRDFLQRLNSASFGKSAVQNLEESETIIRICT